jgi:hypothetical protein
MNKQNEIYIEYKNHLAQYSVCITPIIKALSERYVNQILPSNQPINLDDYCKYERIKVIEFRDKVKNLQ